MKFGEWKRRVSAWPRVFEEDSLRRFFWCLLLAAVVNIVFVLVYCRFFILDFSMSDDVLLNSFVAGAYGPCDGMTVYLNLVLGKFLAALYAAAPVANWYGVFLLAAAVLSFSLAEAVLLERFGLKYGLLLCAFITAAFAAVILNNFTYTIVAYCCATGSVMCFFGGYRSRGKKRWVCYAFGLLLLLLCTMIRKDVTYTAALVLLVFCLVAVLRRRRAALATLAVVLCGLAVCAGLWALDDAAYRSDEEWLEYTRFNQVRTEYTDFGMVDYTQYSDTYQQYGWTPVDYQMYNTYLYPEGEKYSTEVLEHYIEAGKEDRYRKDADGLTLELAQNLQERDIMVAALLVLCAFVAAAFSDKNKAMAVFLLLLPFAVNLLFLAMRRPVFRVVYPHYMMAAVLLAGLADPAAMKERLGQAKGWRRPVAVLLALVGGFLMFCNLADAAVYRIRKESDLKEGGELYSCKELRAYTEKHPESTFVIPGLLVTDDIFAVPQRDSLKNCLMTGSWASHTKYYNETKRAYGIENMYNDLVKKDNYFIVDSGALGLLYQYYEQELGIEVTFEPVAEAGNYCICRVVILNQAI